MLIVACELGQMVPIREMVGRAEGRIIKSFVSIRTPIIVTSAAQASRYYHITEDCKHYCTLQIPLYISKNEMNTYFTEKNHEYKQVYLYLYIFILILQSPMCYHLL